MKSIKKVIRVPLNRQSHESSLLNPDLEKIRAAAVKSTKFARNIYSYARAVLAKAEKTVNKNQ